MIIELHGEDAAQRAQRVADLKDKAAGLRARAEELGCDGEMLDQDAEQIERQIDALIGPRCGLCHRHRDAEPCRFCGTLVCSRCLGSHARCEDQHWNDLATPPARASRAYAGPAATPLVTPATPYVRPPAVAALTIHGAINLGHRRGRR